MAGRVRATLRRHGFGRRAFAPRLRACFRLHCGWSTRHKARSGQAAVSATCSSIGFATGCRYCRRRMHVAPDSTDIQVLSLVAVQTDSGHSCERNARPLGLDGTCHRKVAFRLRGGAPKQRSVDLQPAKRSLCLNASQTTMSRHALMYRIFVIIFRTKGMLHVCIL